MKETDSRVVAEISADGARGANQRPTQRNVMKDIAKVFFCNEGPICVWPKSLLWAKRRVQAKKAKMDRAVCSRYKGGLGWHGLDDCA